MPLIENWIKIVRQPNVAVEIGFQLFSNQFIIISSILYRMLNRAILPMLWVLARVRVQRNLFWCKQFFCHNKERYCNEWHPIGSIVMCHRANCSFSLPKWMPARCTWTFVIVFGAVKCYDSLERARIHFQSFRIKSTL